jgi:hypothetical protein
MDFLHNFIFIISIGIFVGICLGIIWYIHSKLNIRHLQSLDDYLLHTPSDV